MEIYEMVKELLSVGCSLQEISDKLYIEFEEINISDFHPQEL